MEIRPFQAHTGLKHASETHLKFSMWYPIIFDPIIKERVWGGRRLEDLYGKAAPPGVLTGESWEATDRPEGVSRISNGPLVGKDLLWMMENHPVELLGAAKAAGS